MGFAAALVLVIGGAVAFASQTLPRSSPPVAPDPPPPPPLTVLPPPAAVIRAANIDLTVVAPANLRPDQRYQVRVFVNDRPVGRSDMPPDSDRLTLKDVPLDEGQNLVAATLVGDGGESPRSAPISVRRDDVAPVIKILQPDATVYTDDELLLGKTEPGADISITDGSGRPIQSSISADGRFSAELVLHLGGNDLVLHSTDVAGNTATSRVTIQRATSAANIILTVTPTEIYRGELPASVVFEASVRDELGRPVDGTQVVFGVTPPDRATTTYSATVNNGRARFTGFTVDAGDATGAWLVTALASLPSGIELRADAPFRILALAPKSPAPR